MDEEMHYNGITVMDVREAVTQAMMQRVKGILCCNGEIFSNICRIALIVRSRFKNTKEMKIWISRMVDKCRDKDGNITLVEESRNGNLR